MGANTLTSIIATLPDYMREDDEVRAALSSANYGAYRAVYAEYPHPDDQDALTRAWNAIVTAMPRKPVMRCRDCGAYGHTDHRGLGISCGCAAE